MALVQWKQIDGDLSGSRVLTGSLEISGSLTVDSLVANTGVTFDNNLRVGGDLTVDGDTFINSTNLLVKDKFILLNSGSADPDEGGLIIDEGNKAGHAFVFDSNTSRFGLTGSLAAGATSVTPDAFIPAVVDENSGHTDKTEYQKPGNIKIDSSGEVWIYVE